MPDAEITSAAVRLRFMELDDLDEVIECEISRFVFDDPDFDYPAMPTTAWDANDVTEAVRQGRSTRLGTYDTRSYVATTPIQFMWDGVMVDHEWACGALIFELRPEGYHVRLLSQHANADDSIREEFLSHLVGRAERSEQRKTITADVADGDWSNLKFFQDHGFDVKLVPNGFDGERVDAWQCTLRVHGKKNDKTKQMS